MTKRNLSAFTAAIALSLGLAACANPKTANHSLNSTAQPLVERQNFTLDVATTGNGLGVPEQRRLSDWFETMNLHYGDRIALDGATVSTGVRSDVAALAGRYGLLLADGAPVTQGYVAPGSVRVVITRSRAFVPHCPDWSGQYNTSLGNETSPGYGCAVNANFAAMVADPEHLLHGAQGTGETVVMSGTKAIATYRAQEPTGKAGLPKVSSQAGAGGN